MKQKQSENGEPVTGCPNCGESTETVGINGFCKPCEADWKPGDQTAEIIHGS